MQSTAHPGLVALSAAVAIFVVHTALGLITRISSAPQQTVRLWFLGGGIAVGISIWAVRFMSLLGYSLPITPYYDISLLIGSLAIAIATALFALRITTHQPLGLPQLAGGAVIMGTGFVSMHYTSILALVPMITYHTPLLVVSFMLAVVAAFVGLWLCTHLRERYTQAKRWAGALLLGLVASGMHYTDMAAIDFAQNARSIGTITLDGTILGVLIGIFALGLLSIVSTAAAYDGRLESRIRGHQDDLARVNARLEHVATHDQLTGLPNRMLLRNRLSQHIAFAERRPGHFAVITIDLDRFKTVNESLGYAAGDELLREMARRLTAMARKEDTLARSGGDEFVILMPDVGAADTVERVCQGILEELAKPVDIHPLQIQTTPSIGVCLFPADGSTIDALLARSAEALLHAKKLGRNRYQFYAQGMTTFDQEALELEIDLRHALERQQFQLHYQPKVDVSSGKIVGVEALLRWFHPKKGSIPPDRFIPIAEETGLILPIGEWVLREACHQARRWQDAGLPFLRMAVNLSAAQFRQPDLEHVIRSALEDVGLDPDVLEIELTESSIMTDAEGSARILEALSGAGVIIAIDDFGKGYSSMSYLQRFPIDKLKVDRSFVRELTVNPDSAAIVKAIVSLAHSLRLKVVAEGVESYGQLDFLRSLRCDQYQGYLCSRPLPAAELANLVRSRMPQTEEEDFTRTYAKLAAHVPGTT